MDFPKRMIQRGGVSMPSWEQPHIYKDPPKSIMTRKKERVTEADTLWAFRPDGPSSDPTRINEAISYMSKSVNPAVGVSYQGFNSGGSKTNYLPATQSGSLYKVEVVRPPMYPAESLLPLSRPRIHQTKAVETNPGSNLTSYSTIADNVDRTEINFAVQQAPSAGPKTIQATSYYKLEAPSVMSARWAINERSHYSSNTNPGIVTDQLVYREESNLGTIIRPKYSVSSNIKLGQDDNRNDDASSKVRSEVLLKNIQPNYQLVIYDPSNHVSTEVSSNIRQKEYMAIQASLGKPIILERNDGSTIKLKDYNWTAIQTNVGVDQLILTLEDPEIQLERNVPLYTASSAVSLPSDSLSRKNLDYNLEGKLAVNAQTNMDLSSLYNQESLRDAQGRTKLNREVVYNTYDNDSGYVPSYQRMDVNTRQRDTSRYQQANNEGYGRTVNTF